MRDEVERKLQIIAPVGFIDIVMLEKNAALVVTDSGGVQKEAFFHRVPCITLRDETEWVEVVELGWNQIVPPTDADDVYQRCLATLKNHQGKEGQPYGDGKAAEKILDMLI